MLGALPPGSMASRDTLLSIARTKVFASTLFNAEVKLIIHELIIMNAIRRATLSLLLEKSLGSCYVLTTTSHSIGFLVSGVRATAWKRHWSSSPSSRAQNGIVVEASKATIPSSRYGPDYLTLLSQIQGMT